MIGQKTLEYSHSIGLYALRGRGFNNPVDLAFGRDEVMYVLNRAGPEVAVRMPYKRITMCSIVCSSWLPRIVFVQKQTGAEFQPVCVWFWRNND